MIGRREFITLLGGATAGAVICPLAARAQKGAKVPRIGYLGYSSPPLERHLVEAFQQGLRSIGYVDGQNVAIEYRSADGMLGWLETAQTGTHVADHGLTHPNTCGRLEEIRFSLIIAVIFTAFESLEPLHTRETLRILRSEANPRLFGLGIPRNDRQRYAAHRIRTLRSPN
jgi:hypothetical protein